MVKKSSSKKSKGPKAKSIRKKINLGAKSTEVVYHSTKEIKVERAVIENFIGLQRVMVNLSNKFDNLSSQISKLLDLFEISAKSLAKKELSSTGELETKRVMEKLENISQQAGLIGKGLALIHEVGTENGRPVIPLNPQRNKVQFSLPASAQTPLISQNPPSSANFPEKMTKELEGFERSIVNKEEKTVENA
jgi:hypothetical protein